MSCSPVGIDVDGERLRCIQLERACSRRRAAVAIAELPIPSERAENGEAILRALLDDAGLTGRPTLVAAGPGESPRDALLAMLDAAGCTPTVCTRAEALLRAASTRAMPIVVLEIAARRSAIVIGRAGAVELARTLDLGAHDLDSAIAVALGVDREDARSLRSTSCGDEDVETAIAEALRPLFEDVARAVTLALRSHGLAYRGSAPHRIVLAGTGSRDRTLHAQLRRVVGLRVTRARTALAPCVKGRLDGAWTVATGLALGAVGTPSLMGIAA